MIARLHELDQRAVVVVGICFERDVAFVLSRLDDESSKRMLPHVDTESQGGEGSLGEHPPAYSKYTSRAHYMRLVECHLKILASSLVLKSGGWVAAVGRAQECYGSFVLDIVVDEELQNIYDG